MLKKMLFCMGMAGVLLFGIGTSSQAASKVKINEKNFAWAVKEYAEKADTNKDGYLSQKEASKVTKVRFFSSSNIDSFRGIEYFTNLRTFYFKSMPASDDYDDFNIDEDSTASELDLSGLKKLQQVKIDNRTPYLKEVNLEDCTNLETIDIQGWVRDDNTNLQSLNLEGCKNLRKVELICNIKQLNLSGFKKLTELSVDGEQLKTLNLKNCTNLKSLCASGDNLTKVILKGDKNLESLDLKSSTLGVLDLRTNTQLKDLYLGWGIKLTSLDLSNNKKLTTMTCYQTELTSLDFRNNKNLVKLNCMNNKNLANINVKGCKKLRNLRCDNTALTKLNVKTNTDLRRIICRKTGITKLNLNHNKNLKYLWCSNTGIRTLDLSKTKIKNASGLKCDNTVSITYAKK